MHYSPTKILAASLATTLLSACAGGDKPTPNEQTVIAIAGDDQSALNSQYILLDGSRSASQISSSAITYNWAQISGPDAVILKTDDDAQLAIITPADITANTTLTFELTVDDGSNINTDTVDIEVAPCISEPGVIFGDCVGTGFGALLSYERKEPTNENEVAQQGLFYQPQGDRHLIWETYDTLEPGHDTVISVTFGANDPFDEINDNGWLGFGINPQFPVDSTAADLSTYANGAIQFDVREPSGLNSRIEISAECFWPCTSESIFFTARSDWQTITISIADLVESGVDISNLSGPLLFRTPWFQQNSSQFDIDNVRLIKNYTPPTLPELPIPSEAVDTLDFMNAPFHIIADFDISAIRNTENNDVAIVFGPNTTFSAVNIGDGLDSSNFGINIEDYFHGNLVIEYTVDSYDINTTMGEVNNNQFVINANFIGGPLFPSLALPNTNIGDKSTISIPIKELVKRGLNLKQLYYFQIKYRGTATQDAAITIHGFRLEYLPE